MVTTEFQFLYRNSSQQSEKRSRRPFPGCEAFVGVVVRPKTPESGLDANWELAGAKYGKADKNIVNEALMAIVAQMQNEFLITEH